MKKAGARSRASAAEEIGEDSCLRAKPRTVAFAMSVVDAALSTFALSQLSIPILLARVLWVLAGGNDMPEGKTDAAGFPCHHFLR